MLPLELPTSYLYRHIGHIKLRQVPAPVHPSRIRGLSSPPYGVVEPHGLYLDDPDYFSLVALRSNKEAWRLQQQRTASGHHTSRPTRPRKTMAGNDSKNGRPVCRRRPLVSEHFSREHLKDCCRCKRRHEETLSRSRAAKRGRW